MTPEQDLDAVARSIVEGNRFMALGTADGSGLPWVSPVWYTPLSYREYVWVSRPELLALVAAAWLAALAVRRLLAS